MALLTLAFASCQEEPLPESGDAIRFSVAPATAAAVGTKADLPDESNYLIYDGSKIGVWGSYKVGEGAWTDVFVPDDATQPELPKTVTCSKPADAATWSYTTPRYWNRKASYRFCAVFPTTAAVQDGSGSDKVIVNYPSLPGYDLMVASSPLIDAATNGSNPVNLKFEHAGAAVRFLFAKTAGDTKTYNVTGLTLQNISVGGTMTYKGASNDGGASISWALAAAGTATPWTVTKPVPEATTDVPFDIITDPEWIFTVPQTLDATSATVFPALTVNYTVDGQALEVTLNLKTTKITKWEIGKAYTYKIMVNPNAIDLTVEWTDWGEGGSDTLNTGKVW